mgnify:CR=1 FL=1
MSPQTEDQRAQERWADWIEQACAALGLDPEAVAAVLNAKGRGRDMPPPVLIPDVRTVDGLARAVRAARRASDSSVCLAGAGHVTHADERPCRARTSSTSHRASCLHASASRRCDSSARSATAYGDAAPRTAPCRMLHERRPKLMWSYPTLPAALPSAQIVKANL